MQDFKNKRKNLMRGITFLVILLVLFGVISIKTESILISSDRLVPIRNKNMYRIQREQENSIDVIVLGDSLSYSGITPMRLWKDYGYTSFVCGQSGQKMWEAEEMLQTVLKVQQPKIVILETNAMFRDQKSGKKLNDSLEAVLNYYIPVFRGHDVWKSLVMNKEYVEENYKGFAFRCAVNPYEKGNYMNKTTEVEEIDEDVMENLIHISDMCEECGARLILLSTPSPVNHNYARHNALSECAKEMGLSYIDMNLFLELIGINWKTDSLDYGDHLNLSGAEKVTKYLGKYLSENENLTDHRTEEAYRSWTQESVEYEEKASQQLQVIRGGS